MSPLRCPLGPDGSRVFDALVLLMNFLWAINPCSGQLQNLTYRAEGVLPGRGRHTQTLLEALNRLACADMTSPATLRSPRYGRASLIDGRPEYARD